MVAKFLDDNKLEVHLKSEFALFQSSSILFGFIFFVSGVESERTVSKFRKRKRKLLRCVHLLLKRAREIRKFHVVIVQRWLRNLQKSAMLVQTCFAYIYLLLVCRSRCRRRVILVKLPIVLIQKFCYHGNMTYSSLLYSVQVDSPAASTMLSRQHLNGQRTLILPSQSCYSLTICGPHTQPTST